MRFEADGGRWSVDKDARIRYPKRPPTMPIMMSMLRVLLLATAGLWLGLAAGPASAQYYAIGPRDVVSITGWGQADLTKDYPVDQDGSISFPLIGRVKAAGLTTGG